MMDSKTRAKLRSYANTVEAILQVGKNGMGEALQKQVDDALNAAETSKQEAAAALNDAQAKLHNVDAEAAARRTAYEQQAEKDKQQLLADAMKAARIKAPVLPTVKQIITANAAFEQAVFARSLCHAGQPGLTQAASNCEKRAIGSNGGFGYRSLTEGGHIELLDSVILAHWQCAEGKAKRRQRTSY